MTMPRCRYRWWPGALLGVVVVLGVQGCAQDAPRLDLGSWVHSEYVADQRSPAATAISSWLSALQRSGLTPVVRAVADGCGEDKAGAGGFEGISDWGVTCDREVVVSIQAADGVDAAQTVIVNALTKVGWTHWKGTLSIPLGCGAGLAHGVQADAPIPAISVLADLFEWRLTCPASSQPAADYGAAATGCPNGPVGGWIAWAWSTHFCRAIGVISRNSAESTIVLTLGVLYATVDRGTSTETDPPSP